MEEERPANAGPLGNVYLLSYGFNQDYSCFACGTTAGFRVYTAWPTAEVHRREHLLALQHRPVALISMLFKTNLFAMVLARDDGASSHKVQIWDDRRGEFVGELRSRYEVKGVVMRRDIIAMVCECVIYVYTADRLNFIMHLTTNLNPRGICVLATASNPWILCCPGQTMGSVRVQIGQDTQATHVFQAHRTPVSALAVNAAGTLVATASETGTVMKVFRTTDGQILFRLRRSTRPATISCLTFSHDDRFLAVASSSFTVHIFKLDNATAGGGEMAERDPEAEEDAPTAPAMNPAVEQLAAQLQRAAETATEVVRNVLPPYFNDLRSFAQFRIPDLDTNGQPMVDTRGQQASILGPQVAFHQTEPRLLVLHYSGLLYECSFRPDQDPSLGTQSCGLLGATTWFATRPDFKGPNTQVAEVAGGAGEDDDGAEAWQLL